MTLIVGATVPATEMGLFIVTFDSAVIVKSQLDGFNGISEQT